MRSARLIHFAAFMSLSCFIPACDLGDIGHHLQATTAQAVQDKQEKQEKQVLLPDQKHKQELEAEAEQGRKYAADVEKQLKISSNQEYNQRVQKIATILADIARVTAVETKWGDKRLNAFNYEFKVVQGDDVNAFSLPGGFIYVYEGLVKSVESDDELAGVIAHEISHASMRHLHTLQREQSKIDLLTIPLILVSIFAAGSSQDATAAATAGSLFSQAMGSGWSQRAELAADYGAFQYLLKSPYNPVALLTFMERLAFQERLGPKIEWGIYRSHPPSPERAEAIAQFLHNSGIPIRRSEVTTSLRATLKPSDTGTVDIWFGGQVLHSFAGDTARPRAEQGVAQLNRFFDSMPALFEVSMRGEVAILGRGSVLFEISPEDAAKVKKSLDDTADSAVKMVKRAIFGLGQRIFVTARS